MSLKLTLDLPLSGVSGQVHPSIYGHPSPLAFLGWTHALVRGAWQHGFGHAPAREAMTETLRAVTVVIGLLDMRMRGEATRAMRGSGDDRGWTTIWHFPMRRAAERNKPISELAISTGTGDDPRLDGHWKLAIELPDDLQTLARGPEAARFLHWVEAWQRSHPLAGGFPRAEATAPPAWQTAEALQQADGFFEGAWLMTPPEIGAPFADFEAYVAEVQQSRYRSRHRLPTVLGYHLLEAPQADRPGARQNLRHAYADPILGLAAWTDPSQGLPAWMLDVQREAPPHGLILACAPQTALFTAPSALDDF